jgi:hypothetical protein
MKGLTKNEKQFNITQLLKDDFPFMHIHHDPRRKYSDKDFNLDKTLADEEGRIE